MINPAPSYIGVRVGSQHKFSQVNVLKDLRERHASAAIASTTLVPCRLRKSVLTGGVD